MAFVIIFVSFSMIVGAYLIGNMTALIVKGSKTVKYRDRMTELTRYMNRNRLGPRLHDQIKEHLRLQFESSYTDADLLRDIPVSIRLKYHNVKSCFYSLKTGALFKIKNVGNYLCTLVSEGDSDLLWRLLSHGMDPNSTDYDHRTPLHVAVSQGLYLSAKLLVDAGANVFYKDRWGNTPLH